jgi:hypothetical protein
MVNSNDNEGHVIIPRRVKNPGNLDCKLAIVNVFFVYFLTSN